MISLKSFPFAHLVISLGLGDLKTVATVTSNHQFFNSSVFNSTLVPKISNYITIL